MFALFARLLRDQHIAQHCLRLRHCVLSRIRQVYTTFKAVFKRPFPPASRVDLAFDHHALVAFGKNFFDRRLGLVERGSRLAGGHGHAVATHQFLGLIFVKVHKKSVPLLCGKGTGRSSN